PKRPELVRADAVSHKLEGNRKGMNPTIGTTQLTASDLLTRTCAKHVPSSDGAVMRGMAGIGYLKSIFAVVQIDVGSVCHECCGVCATGRDPGAIAQQMPSLRRQFTRCEQHRGEWHPVNETADNNRTTSQNQESCQASSEIATFRCGGNH